MPSCQGRRSAPASGSTPRSGPSCESNARKKPAAARRDGSEKRRLRRRQTRRQDETSRSANRLSNRPGETRGSKNSHEDDGPQAPPVLSHLCRRLAQSARRPRAGRTGHLRPDGQRRPTPGPCSRASGSTTGWASAPQPSDTVRVLIKKYGADGTHVDEQQAAREQLALPKVVPDAGEPVYVRPAEDGQPRPAAEAARPSRSRSGARRSGERPRPRKPRAYRERWPACRKRSRPRLSDVSRAMTPCVSTC